MKISQCRRFCLNLVCRGDHLEHRLHGPGARCYGDGFPVADRDLVHLAPTLRAHINPYGKYSFDVEGGLARGRACDLCATRPSRHPRNKCFLPLSPTPDRS